ncbi:TPA: DUF3018 family protein [Salmonella enterica subsp. enterica serovar Duisburg]|nr:DUF3018 family protein [Salmonella enterica]HBJ6959248.1 DUF3018 family protein [Salmonella enterica subsp. enterica serovar Duisburg]
MSTKMEQEESNWLALCCRGVVDECRRQAGIVAQADASDETTGDFLDESAADVDEWDE